MTRSLRFTILILFSALLTVSCTNRNTGHSVSSPDGLNKLTFHVDQGIPVYAFERKGESIFLPSKLGFVMKDGTRLGEKMKIDDIVRSSFNETWEQPWGEKRLIENRYEEMKVHLSSGNGDPLFLNLFFRVYNDGFAFRYEIPEQAAFDSLIIADELSQFALATIDSAWWIPAYKGVYY
nr:glycoside hydrolase family 97 N-terminal domain-containing protein [Prolixibacteraceae bacterium]